VDSLEQYLSDQKPVDQRDIEAVESLLEEVARVYLRQFEPDAAWPYEVKAEETATPTATAQGITGTPVPSTQPKKRPSQSTTAMILGSLLRLMGKYRVDAAGNLTLSDRANVFPLKFRTNDFEQLMGKMIERASEVLLDDIDANVVYSSTFGEDDVFTLCWLAEAGVAKWGAPDNGSLSGRWKARTEKVFATAEAKLDEWKKKQDPRHLFDPATVRTPNRGRDATPLRHAFPVLRLVQIIRYVKGTGGGALPEHFKYFEETLHEHLSFSSIPDSRFDPAELAFCLEGMLLCQHNVVERSLFERVLNVLSSAQQDSAYWRPVKPYLASQQGLVLFPVSVEVANSIMRSAALFDGDDLHGSYASQAVPMMRRYWQWITAREVRLHAATVKRVSNVAPPDEPGRDIVGWHSEHVNDPTVIHLWETSQVIEFLLSYRNALHRHIARTTLIRSRFKVTECKHDDGAWDARCGQEEPVSVLGPNIQVYKSIDKLFVQPRRGGGKPRFSMLLYGPPGTGKTRLAESLAHALGVRLITLTVSDFLAGGAAQIEARAKDIFETLTAQPLCVILFDEIDHFLLDRDSPLYTKQDTVFQFMTPGMLTKLNDLRRANRAVFVVATNYEDRIDAAIKRTGRVDAKYLVLPPDATRREHILRGLILRSERARKRQLFEWKIDNLPWLAIRRASLFLGYPDMEAVVQASERDEPVTAREFLRDLETRARTISLEMYVNRFPSKEGSDVDLGKLPVAEFLGLLALVTEVYDAPNDRHARVLGRIAPVLGKGCGSDANAIVRDYTPLVVDNTTAALRNWLTKWME
jgi:hypothetical protein